MSQTSIVSNGIEVISTVLASAASYDLTDLATVKDELSLQSVDTSNDTWLGRAISQVSKVVMSATNRVFAPEYVQDNFDINRNRYQLPMGTWELQLSRWPILAVSSVVQTVDLGGSPATQTLVAGTDFEIDYANGRLLRLNSNTGRVMGWEAFQTVVKYTAGYGAAVSETHSVPANPGPYTVTVAGAATFSCDQTVAYASSGVLLTPIASGTPAAGQYTVALGVYTFAAADAGQSLNFAYCTESIPLDLVDAALRTVTVRFKAKGRDPSLVQRETPGIGTERFWFGPVPGQYGAFPPDIDAMLERYRVPQVG